MKKSISSDLGENFTYAKKLIENRIELAKLDIAEYLARFIGHAVIAIILLSIGSMLFAGLLIALAIWLGQIFQSITAGILAVSGLLFILGAVLFFLRKNFIFEPAARLIYSIIDDDDE